MYREELERILNSPNQAFELTKYVNDDLFIQEFVEFTRPYFISAKNDSIIDSITEKAVFMAFTFVALKHYDGKIWEHIYKYYEAPTLTQRDIYNKVRINVFSQWVKGYHCDTSKREQTYQIPVIESIIPLQYAIKYIDFVFDIYEKCFQYSLENVDEELDLFFDATRDLLQADDGKSDTFENTDSDGSSKTYILIQGTKRILKYDFKNKVKQLKEFTKQFLLRLDNYYGQQGTIEPNYYFDKSFDVWIKEHPEIKIKKSTGAREVYLKNRKPRFFLDTNTGKIYLTTPMLHTLKKENPYKIKVRIYENGNEIYCLPAHINDMMSLIEIGSHRVEIENPLNNISCTITYEDEILYPTNEAYKDALFRKNLFFNNEKEVKPNSNYSGKLYAICKSENQELGFVKRMPNYVIYKTDVSEDNYSFIIDSNHFSFKSSFDSEILGDVCKPMIIDFQTGNISAFRRIKSLVLTSNNKSVRGNYIKINNSIIQEDFYEAKEQKNNVAYILDVNKLFLENGFYDVKLLDKSNNHIVDEYAFLLDVNLRFDETIIGDDSISCNFSSSYSIEDRNESIISSYTNKIKLFENNEFFININEIKLKFSLIVTVPFFVLDHGEKSLFGTEISINTINLNSILCFYNTKDSVKLRFGESSRNILVKNTNGEKYIELSELKNHESEDLVEIVFLDDRNEEYKITIYNK
ncbi:MAG: hypothetical protein K6G28_00010, partial [Acholeplasmatales bacterium]|nr:hypothetical protein [Acholeplasmatales bacterium]